MNTTALHRTTRAQLDDEERRAILAWRFDSLARAGYATHDALVLASHPEVDLHLAVSLADRGCASATALRILL